MSPDKLTSYLGIVIGALHQVGVVGTLPTTKAEWMQTALSVGFMVFGYLTNKLPALPQG